MQEILQAALVRYDAYGRPQKRATVSVDGKSRTLIVTGDPRELQSVATIIEQLDTSLGQQVVVEHVLGDDPNPVPAHPGGRTVGIAVVHEHVRIIGPGWREAQDRMPAA